MIKKRSLIAGLKHHFANTNNANTNLLNVGCVGYRLDNKIIFIYELYLKRIMNSRNIKSIAQIAFSSVLLFQYTIR